MVISYCSICTLPTEYCQYGCVSELCQKALDESLGKAREEGASVSTTKSSEPSIKQSTGKKTRKQEIVLKLTKRRNKKLGTTILGLELFGKDLHAVSKALATHLACSVSLGKNESNLDVLTVQAEVPEKVTHFLSSSLGIPKEKIVFQKK